MTSAATGSAHDQPNSAFSIKPASRAADRYVHSSVCFESATAETDPSSRPARRCVNDSTGITTRLAAASTMPTSDGRASPEPSNESTASTETYAARAKNENAMNRSAAFSRRSGSLIENCHATAAADDTSMTESRPKPISAEDDTRVPSASATAASTTL